MNDNINSFNWKLFFILLVASLIATILVIPYTLAISPLFAQVFSPFVLFAQLVQNLILCAIAIGIGLLLAKRVGFGLPVLEGWLEGKEVGNYLKSILGISVGLGLLAGVLIVLLSYLFTSSFQFSEVGIPIWKGILASFYGGIVEEILFRLFVMTLIVWIIFKIKKGADGKPAALGIWFAIVLTAILFGLGHLPVTSTITAITPIIIVRAVLLNGVGAIIFGWLYWKKGLESAMISHFSADIVLHVLFPLTLAVFL